MGYLGKIISCVYAHPTGGAVALKKGLKWVTFHVAIRWRSDLGSKLQRSRVQDVSLNKHEYFGADRSRNGKVITALVPMAKVENSSEVKGSPWPRP